MITTWAYVKLAGEPWQLTKMEKGKLFGLWIKSGGLVDDSDQPYWKIELIIDQEAQTAGEA